MVSPCIVNSHNLLGNKLCSEVLECGSTGASMQAYAIKGFDNYKSEILLGVAKDGHMILGPYDDQGLHFDCTAYD
jgi:hypothetical protein